ncbi:hypothetical protein OKW49_006376 [Paraburkholderia youngii]|uniref:hypothetical protein n=1 Tax=Paraburkholderia youngii TaxID=2782701 RepID=UPI003D1C40F5
MKNERLIVRTALSVVILGSGFATGGAQAQDHCDITGSYTCSTQCQNNTPGKASVTALANGKYLFHNETPTSQAHSQAEGYEEKPNTYRVPDWENARATPDAECRELIFSNGTHWSRFP